MKPKLLHLVVLFALLSSLALALMPASPALAAGPWYVDTAGTDDGSHGTGPGAAAFKTIQYAINDSRVLAGDTINVAAGIYDEQIVITKSLTLQGAGNTTVVRPSAPGKLTSLYALPRGVFAGRELASIVGVRGVGASGVRVKDMKLDGANVAPRPNKNQYTVGVLYAETAGTIDGVTVVNMETVSEGPRSYGIWLDAWNAATSIEVEHCYIEHFNRNGIMLSGDHLTADVHDNTIRGITRVSQVPNGIIVIDGAAATINHNTITECHYTPAGPPQWLACAVGMYQYCAPGVLIEYNTISQCDVGIAPSNDAIVSHNLLTGNHIGVALDQGAHNDVITCNDIMNNTDGIVMGLDPGSVVHWNNIVGNTFGVRNLYTTVLDATDNWWGDASGPKDTAGSVEVPPCNVDPTIDKNADGAGNQVSDYVHYCPWLLAPPADVCGKQPPSQPSNEKPTSGSCIRLPVTLQSSDFGDPDLGDTHTASQWQIRTSTGSYDNPVFDSRRDTGNLTSIIVPPGILTYSANYCWRVRHQDSWLLWSDYSAETCFCTENTPSDNGNPVTVNVEGVTITYSEVIVGGCTSVISFGQNPAGPLPPEVCALVPYVDITTTATYSGSVIVALTYDESAVPNENTVRLLHWNGAIWEDVTTSLDTVNNIVYGEVSSLSPFCIGHICGAGGGGAGGVPVFPNIYIGIGAALGAGIIAYLLRKRLIRQVH